MRVLYQDGLVIAVDKPAGVLTVPGRGPQEGEALSVQVRTIVPGALPVHRLDRDTSGVVLFGLTRDAHRALNAAFESRRAPKTPPSLGPGDPPPPPRWRAPPREGPRAPGPAPGGGTPRAP